MAAMQRYDPVVPSGEPDWLERYGHPKMTVNDAETVIALCDKPWFRRVWTIREVALANDVEVIWQSSVMPHEMIGLAAVFLLLSCLFPVLKEPVGGHRIAR